MRRKVNANAAPRLNTQYNRNFCLNSERRLVFACILHRQNRQGAGALCLLCRGYSYRGWASASRSQAAASASLHSTQCRGRSSRQAGGSVS